MNSSRQSSQDVRDGASPGLFAPVRGKLVIAFLGALLSGVLSTIPFIAAVEVVRLLLPAADPAVPGATSGRS